MTYGSQAAFDAHYRFSTEAGDGSTYGYERCPQLVQIGSDHWEIFKAAMAPATGDRILVVGAGLGFMIEAAHADGYANVWGLDDSPAMHGNPNTDPSVVIVDGSYGSPGGQILARLRQGTGDDIFDHVVSESMAESYDDAELLSLLPWASNILAPGGDVSHLVVTDPGLDPVFNVKTLTEWKALYPAHTWISVNTREAL